MQDYQTLSPNFGLNCWAAFTPAVYHQALLTGQLLLLDDEVNPVMSVALKSNLEITGLADSSVFNGLRLKTLDINGVGTYLQLATALRKTFDEIAKRVA